jgi:hypothetical protein
MGGEQTKPKVEILLSLQPSNVIENSELEMTIVNHNPTEILMDPLFLHPILMVRMTDNDAQPVPLAPPPIPRIPRKDELIQLPGNGKMTMRIALSDVTFERLTNNPYRISCELDNTTMKYPVGLNVWQGRVLSNRLLLRPPVPSTNAPATPAPKP